METLSASEARANLDLIRSDMDMAYVQKRLGHSQGYFILKISKMRSRPYLHFRSA
jgi:hypothetical protein